MNIVQISILQNKKCAGGCKFCGLSIDSVVERNFRPDVDSFTDAFNKARQFNARIEVVFPEVGINQKSALDLLAEMSEVIKDNSDVELAINPGICLKSEFYDKIQEYGVTHYRNNIETSRRLFQKLVPNNPNIQSSKIESLAIAKSCGLKTDTGWLCGLGETEDDLRDIYELLTASSPNSITLNYFDPRESAEKFTHTFVSSEIGLERLKILRQWFPSVGITLGGAYQLWIGPDAHNLPEADGVYIGRFLDHGLKAEQVISFSKPNSFIA